MPLLSIIVTSYNIESYIGACLDSICGQTLDDIEIIVVDDGSSDRSPEIISEYAERDPRVIPILFTENTIGGVASAANAGLDRATGTWVGFADGDDLYEADMFRKLVDAAVDGDADLAMCRYLLLDETTQQLSEPAEMARWAGLAPGVHDLSTDQAKKAFLQFIAVPWRKLYRRSLIEEHSIRFPVGDYFYEDNPFHWYSIIAADSIAIVPEVLCYHRVARAGQTMASVGEPQFKIFDHHETIYSFLAERDLTARFGPTLLSWAIAQMEWTTARTPEKLRERLFRRLQTVVSHYDDIAIERAFRESGKGDRARQLVQTIKTGDLPRFHRILDGPSRTSLTRRALHHLKYSGPKHTAKVAGRYVTKQVRGLTDGSTLAALPRREAAHSDELSFMLAVIERRLRTVETAIDDLRASVEAALDDQRES